jgi:hypothetical protein
MATALTYTTYTETMANLLVMDDVANTEFVQILPAMISYAEDRIQNDLDLIAAFGAETITLTGGTPTGTIPTGMYIVDSINIVTPAGTAPDSGVRHPTQRMSVEQLHYIWPDSTVRDMPQYYAILNDTDIIFAPVPDDAYKAEVIGVSTLTPISGSNATNWISINLPELLIAASCVFGFGWQRDFGQQSGDPSASISWESQYQALLKSDTVQEFRKKAQSAGWTPFSPSPLASPRA